MSTNSSPNKLFRGKADMAKAVRKMRNRRDERRAQYDALRNHTGRKRPGSMKKKAKSAATNRGNKGRKL